MGPEWGHGLGGLRSASWGLGGLGRSRKGSGSAHLGGQIGRREGGGVRSGRGYCIVLYQDTARAGSTL